jgi:hypothetical protein
MKTLPRSWGLVAVCVLFAGAIAAEPKPAIDPAAKAQLEKVQQLVGQWRGVGQPRRGSVADSWVEQADWAWTFEPSLALVSKHADGKYFSALKLVPAEKAGHYDVIAAPAAGGNEARYTGTLDDAGKLLAIADEPRAGLPDRISFRFVADGDRLLVLLERKTTGDQFARLAEIGYTRQGSGFGQGKTGPECVVTGGLGTIAVMHKGEKYSVCCTGCLEYFNDNPNEVIAEYQARKAEEAKKKDSDKP